MIKTKVVHSKTKSSWNVVGTELGKKYKIARVPYIKVDENSKATEILKNEAYEHATFISWCFNYADKIHID